MGCINNSPKVIIRSMKSSKKGALKDSEHEHQENLDNKYFTSPSSEEEDNSFHSSLEQSQIPIKAKMEGNELIFL